MSDAAITDKGTPDSVVSDGFGGARAGTGDRIGAVWPRLPKVVAGLVVIGLRS
jgi:hypothetical protein